MADEPKHDPGTWAAFYQATAGREPRPLFAKGMATLNLGGASTGQAVEIGFGDGTETLALLEAGWQVLAIDPAPEAAERLRSQVPPAAAGRLSVQSAPAGASRSRHSICCTRATASRSWTRRHSVGSGPRCVTSCARAA